MNIIVAPNICTASSSYEGFRDMKHTAIILKKVVLHNGANQSRVRTLESQHREVLVKPQCLQHHSYQKVTKT